ncbi:hypothetical protein [Wenyingzhuangia sp. 2_MG-2023]|uniref:hypothetical protein n=1 Tax=Wenyingzhuangia sp. 2_MG-2023 TaxID=3062639 RepID=UPI0026E3A274|nr:hypothetical protein [Wenyingzhuangia sp. 2_MG-2023]MDO6738153.1 hypothetical protein [Wenyingzhuangia sp. 2_MG-2023]
MRHFKKISFLAVALSLLVACSPENSTLSSSGSGSGSGSSSGILSKSIMITNAGDGVNTGSLTYIDTDGEVTNDYFQAQNDGAILGKDIKAISFGSDGYDYIIVDQYIVAVDKDYIYQNTYYGDLSDPAYLLSVKGTAGYIIDWGTAAEAGETPYITLTGIEEAPWLYVKGDYILLNTLKPEKIVQYEGSGYNKFFISHYENSIVSVVDLESSGEVTEITLNDNVDDLFVVGDKIALLAKGNPGLAAIQEIDVTDNSFSTKYTFATDEYPTALVYANESYYYALNDKIYKMGINSNIPTEVLQTTFTDFTIDGNYIYGINSSTTGENSTFSAYNLTTGSLLVSSEIGINANNIYIIE